MKRTRIPLFLGIAGSILMLALIAGCYRPAAPDATPTPAAGAEVALTEEEIAATAVAEATRVAQSAQEGEETQEPLTETPIASSPAPTTEPELQPTATLPPETAEPVAAATATSPAPVPTATPTTAGSTTTESVTHVVQRGENLYRIALRYGTTVQALASANGIANSSLLYVGQTLVIPSGGTQPPQQPEGGTTHVVQAGENLFRIALRYNMSYLALAQYNGIANSSQVYVGQVLRIPPQ